MAKVSFISIVLCALASLSVSFAEPSTYGAMPPPAMYPPPAKYEAPPPAPTPAPAKYEAPAPAKYEAPAPAPVKYEAPAPVKYEEKKEKYPMKTEYKKMEYGGKKYRRSVAGDEKEEAKNDVKQDVTASAKRVQRLRDAVMKDIVSDPIWGFGFRYRRYPYFGFGYRRFPYYGFRRFGYRRFWDGEQDSAAQTSSHFEMENDDHLAESDAVSTPKRKWLTEDDLDEMMDAAPQGRWWAPQEMDEMMDAAPKRKWRSPEEFDDLMDPVAMGARCIWMGGRLIC